MENNIEIEDIRTCTECHKEMNKGYCVDDGLEYYCSDECLYKNYTDRGYLELYLDDRAYYTEWEQEKKGDEDGK